MQGFSTIVSSPARGRRCPEGADEGDESGASPHSPCGLLLAQAGEGIMRAFMRFSGFKHYFVLLCIIASHFIATDAFALVLNNPYPPSQSSQKIYYSSFSEQPKTLDPARSYSNNEYVFIAQIYEPLLGYDYLIRPYQLIPVIATELPEIRYLDAQKNLIPPTSTVPVAYSVYTIHIQPGVKFQPHPALAKNDKGSYEYHHLSADYLDDHGIRRLSDFKHTGTRELTVDDYIYEIKRLANPAVGSPIYGLMSEYILGFKDFSASMPKRAAGVNPYVDLRLYPMEGLRKIDDYTFEITLKGQYAQFLFWLAMPFFSPIPWEADVFYSQPGMEERNLTLGWYPIGTGPFLLSTNNPNRSMILKKNPQYRAVYFPVNGSTNDKDQGFELYAGKRLPLIDKAIFTLEKESIPRWNKFLQGYYDVSAVTADSFDQAIRINQAGEATLSSEMVDKKMYLEQTPEPYIYYMGFNMLDAVVGGNSERARKLRQAISIAVNIEEEIAIFYNGRGTPAQGPIPPGIFGYKSGQEGINPIVYLWEDDKPKRRPIEHAKKLMIEAGYPNGIDPATGKNLILHYDMTTSGNPEDKAVMDWVRKQFATIGIDLNVRATLYNRFQEKIRTGNTQIFTWGWDADYPDPENFLFQLYGRNGKVRFGGENATNYSNPQYDSLFDLMKNHVDDADRQQIIDQMLAILRNDAPWVWGFHPQDFILIQSWVSKIKPNPIAPATLKYLSVDPIQRNILRTTWNQAIFWPLLLLLLLILLIIVPLLVAYVKKERQPALRMILK